MTAARANGDAKHDEAKEHARVWKTLTSLAARAVEEEGYAEILASSALPTAIVECIELLQAWPDPNRLEQVTAIPHTSSSFVDELQESIFSAFALQQVHVDDNAFTDTLDTCAHCIADDLEFALFADAILASRKCANDSMTLSPRFLARLFRPSAALTANEEALSQSQAATLVRRQPARAFDQLSVVAMVHVWANHLPSWEHQEWMLQAHMSPYVPMTSIVWRCNNGAPPEDTAVFQSYSYLYVVTVQWFAQYSECLGSPRSLELLSVLSQATRDSVDHRAFGRRLVHDLVRLVDARESADDALWMPRMRVHAFANVPSVLEDLFSTSRATDDDNNYANPVDEKGLLVIPKQHLYEWIGLAERPHILQEVLELLFAAPHEASALNDTSSTTKLQTARHGAATLLGWFYSSISTDSTPQTIADVALTLSSSLEFVDLAKASAWLRQSRAQFEKLTLFRIKLMWFWLLKACYAAADSIRNDAAVVEALESIEYVFRRFSPSSTKHKRAFQVEVVTQLLIDMEWRWIVVVQQQGDGDNVNDVHRRQELQERMDVAVAWLHKISCAVGISIGSAASGSSLHARIIK
uniref:Uncharacterized protein n=1 Tax=Globisporangium ultimum (strain ATCC 200006 / CBS 805.95 / DAOM BR144) TaxID=431595 RepID=K3X4L4_GLOUD